VRTTHVGLARKDPKRRARRQEGRALPLRIPHPAAARHALQPLLGPSQRAVANALSSEDWK